MSRRHRRGTEHDAGALGLDMTGAEYRQPDDDARSAPGHGPTEPGLSDDLADEIAAGSDPNSPLRRRVTNWRAKVAVHPQWRAAYRVVIAAVGGAIVVVGMVLLAIPGPGWLCIFLGLGVLSTEFIWARRISDQLKRILAWATAHWHAFWARRRESKRTRARAKTDKN